MPDHDREFQINRLRGLALQIERGEHDAEFIESQTPIAARRDALVKRIEELVARLEAADAP